MTDELTLREKVWESLWEWRAGDAGPDVLAEICEALEDTGSPAHMRVAAELRGLTPPPT